MTATKPDSSTTNDPELTEGEKTRMEQVIERTATGLGNSVAFLAESGILFVVFAFIWAAFGLALIWSQGSLDGAWEAIRDLPVLAEGLIWLLFLPVMLGLWIWEASWSLIMRLVLIFGIAGWTLLVFPRPWR
jgi:ABC-type amino acid transport system permease subunit